MEKKLLDAGEIYRTAVQVLTKPDEFFRRMPKTGGFVEPMIFLVVMGVAGGLIQAVAGIAGLRPAGGMAMGVASIIILPILIAVFGFVGAGILFVVWKLLGSQESYETAYRCGAYTGALTPIVTVLHFVPYIGAAVGIALSVYLLVVASEAVHGIPAQKAWVAFGIIGLLLILMNLSAEHAARKIAREGEIFRRDAEEATRTLQKQAEQIQKEAEEAARALQEQAEREGRK